MSKLFLFLTCLLVLFSFSLSFNVLLNDVRAFSSPTSFSAHHKHQWNGQSRRKFSVSCLQMSEEKSSELMDVIDEEGKDSKSPEAVGRFRQRRAMKKSSSSSVSSELRFKLLEEQASPLRKFRQFFYAAACISASLGTLISGARIFAALQGIQGVQPLSESSTNTAINLGVVVTSAALWIWEDGKGKETLKLLQDKSGMREKLANLNLELADGTLKTMRDMRDESRLVILAGTAAEVTRCINLAG
ncbi:hypothetical protein GUITHDRAFT_160931, partial [Guillardia theta CCMP2712]